MYSSYTRAANQVEPTKPAPAFRLGAASKPTRTPAADDDDPGATAAREGAAAVAAGPGAGSGPGAGAGAARTGLASSLEVSAPPSGATTITGILH